MLGFGKQKKLPYKKKTPGDKEKERDIKDRKWARDKLMEQAKENPEIERQMIAKYAGVNIKPIDLIESKKKEVEVKLVEEAFNQITKNPELREQYSRKLIDDMVGRPSGNGDIDFSNLEDGSTDLDQLMESLDKYEQLRNKLKGNSSPLSGLINADVIVEALKLVPGISAQLQGKSVPQQSQPIKYIITDTNGEPVGETDSTGYRKLVEAANQKRLAQSEISEETTTSGPPEEETITTEEKEDSSMSSIIFQLISSLDKDPTEVVDELIVLAEQEDKTALLILSTMLNTEAEGIISMLQTMDLGPETQEAITQLVEKQEWLRTAIAYYRGLKENE